MPELHAWIPPRIHKRPQGIDPEIELAYGIPFIWGAVHCSAQAQEAYQLELLAPGVVQDDDIDTTQKVETGLRTDLYVVAPGEHPDYTPHTSLPSDVETGIELEMMANVSMHRRGFEMILGCQTPMSEVGEIIFKHIRDKSEQTGQTVDEILDNPVLPTQETIRQETSQAFIHAISPVIGNSLLSPTTELIRQQSDKNAVNLSALQTGLGAIGGGTMLAFSQISYGNISPFSAILAGIFLGGQGISSYLKMRRYMLETGGRELAIANSALAYGNRVSQDFHNLYCREHFNNQIETLLNGPDSAD